MKARALLAGEERELELAWAAKEQRQIELTQAERYARDPLAFLDSSHVWIFSKFEKAAIRLELYPTQVETVSAWVDLDHLAATGKPRFRNTVEEKSRQMGETWGFAGILLWAVHYHDVSLLAMHTRSAEVDDGGPRSTWRSMFGKVRYMDRRLGSPNGLPATPAQRARVPGLGRLVFRPFSREPAKIENLARGSVVYGEGQTDDPGRGGTFDGAVIDEAAFVTHGEKVYAALDEACPEGKALLSTVHGDDNMHARIADEAPKGWVKLRHHWSQHPIYAAGSHVAGDEPDTCALCAGNAAGIPWEPQDPLAHRYPGRLTSPWYDGRVIGKTDEQVAQELDIDRERALTGRVYPEFETVRHEVADGIPFEPRLPLELAADYGLDATAIIFLQDAPEELRAVALVELGDLFHTTATPQRVAEAVRAAMLDLGVEERFTVPQWTRRLKMLGDPSGDYRNVGTGQSTAQEYRKQGFSPTAPPKHLTATVEPSIRAVKRLLSGSPKPLKVCAVRAAALALHLRNNTWPTDATGRRRPGATKPVDDVHNHACRALAYYAVAKFPPPIEPDTTHWPTKPVVRDGRDGYDRGIRDPGVRYGMSF